MIKAVIFDFDGVILESADIKTEAFRKLFESRFPGHIREIVEYHKKNMGISRFVKFKYIYNRFSSKELSPQKEALLGDEFSKIVFERILNAPMAQGAAEFLKKNHEKYLLFVASGTPKEELIDIMERRDLLRYFKEVFGSPEAKADIIRQVSKKYGLHSSEIVFIGDAESDYKAAGSTRVNFIAKITPSSDLKQCAYHISNLNEINSILNQLNKDLNGHENRKIRL